MGRLISRARVHSCAADDCLRLKSKRLVPSEYTAFWVAGMFNSFWQVLDLNGTLEKVLEDLDKNNKLLIF